MIAEGKALAAIGDITITDHNGNASAYSYCDVWTFENGKMATLRAFVVEKPAR